MTMRILIHAGNKIIAFHLPCATLLRSGNSVVCIDSDVEDLVSVFHI